MAISDKEVVRRKRLAVAYAERHGVDHPGVQFNGEQGRSWIALRTEMNRRAGKPGNPPLKDRLSPAALAMIENADPASKLKAKATRDRLAALRAAKGEVGTTEHPADSNDGPRVHQYEATTGAYRQPWCGSFVTWAFLQAGVKLSGFNTAYVPSYIAAAHAGQHGLRIVGKDQVEPGDLVCYDWQKDGIADHIGFVEDGPLDATVEGNTSFGPGGSQSNGGCVARRTDRSLSDVACFIRVAVA